MDMPRNIQFEKIIALGTAITVFLVGVLVMLGWGLGYTSWIQILPYFAPMQFNTALCFSLLGLSFIFLLFRYTRTGLVCAAIVAIVALLTLFEYVAGVNLGIDQLLMKAYLVVETSHPGRMAPNTAICFVLSSVAAFLIGMPSKTLVVSTAAKMIAFSVLMIACIALVGYFFGIEKTYGWESYTRMALHTAFSFVFIMLSALSFIKLEEKSEAGLLPYWVFVGGVLFVLGLWILLLHHENKKIDLASENVAQLLKSQISIKMREKALALNRVLDRLQESSVNNEKQWRKDVSVYFRDFKTLEMVAWVNQHLQLRWIAPQYSKIDFVQIKKILGNSPKNKKIIVSKVYFDSKNNPFIYVIIRSNDSAEKKGYLVASYHIGGFIQSLLSAHIKKHYAVSVFQDNRMIFQGGAKITTPGNVKRLSRSYPLLSPGGQLWLFTVKQTQTIKNSYLTLLPTLLLIIGSLVVVLLSVITHYFMKMRALTSRNKALLKEALEREDKLEASNKELEAFSYSVSHDLRAPLRHMRGFSEMILQDKDNVLSEESQSHLQLVLQAAKRMGNLIDDLLQFSRVGRFDLKKELVSLESVVHEVIAEVKDSAKDRKIHFNYEKLPTLYADKTMLHFVMSNLIGNAVKFTQHKEEAQIAIYACESNVSYTISIEDNGAGFDNQYADKIFGVFQRLHRNNEFEGTGIGLANVARIILRHEGEVFAKGTVGKGAVISFTLPKQKGEDHA